MPVEIKELVIKAEFGSPRQEAPAARGSESAADAKDDLIQECVRQVLEILDRRQER